jgi:uncharacterized membrane protein
VNGTDETTLERERTLERLLAQVFRAGTLASGSMLFVGLVLSFVWPSHRGTHLLLDGGAFVLLVTPVARVVVSFVDYLLTRDWWFVLWTGIVLALLASSFIAALHA